MTTEKETTRMEIEFVLANEAEHDTLLRNLYQLYLYEFSRFTTEWRVQEDGRFLESDLEGCWENDYEKIFLLRLDSAWVGFAIVDLDVPEDDGSTYNELAEFFIMPPYRRQGIGAMVARKLFDEAKGLWALTIVETNEDALRFWRKVVGRYTNGQFLEQYRPDHKDYLHEFRNG
jgi:predicted acetyltransferase